MNEHELKAIVRELLFTQLFGILATFGRTEPHTTIVSYVAADDLSSLAFATPKDSRKYDNLRSNAHVSIFFDNRTNSHEALLEIWGIEARGTAEELVGPERTMYERLYCAKHPGLSDFAKAAALIRINVVQYDIVSRFQNVTILKPDSRKGEGT